MALSLLPQFLRPCSLCTRDAASEGCPTGHCQAICLGQSCTNKCRLGPAAGHSWKLSTPANGQALCSIVPPLQLWRHQHHPPVLLLPDPARMVAGTGAGQPQDATESLGRSISFSHCFPPTGLPFCALFSCLGQLALCCLWVLLPVQSKQELVPSRAGGVRFLSSPARRTVQFVTNSCPSISQCLAWNFPGCRLGCRLFPLLCLLPGTDESNPNGAAIFGQTPSGLVGLQIWEDWRHS